MKPLDTSQRFSAIAKRPKPNLLQEKDRPFWVEKPLYNWAWTNIRNAFKAWENGTIIKLRSIYRLGGQTRIKATFFQSKK